VKKQETRNSLEKKENCRKDLDTAHKNDYTFLGRDGKKRVEVDELDRKRGERSTFYIVEKQIDSFIVSRNALGAGRGGVYRGPRCEGTVDYKRASKLGGGVRG